MGVSCHGILICVAAFLFQGLPGHSVVTLIAASDVGRAPKCSRSASAVRSQHTGKYSSSVSCCGGGRGLLACRLAADRCLLLRCCDVPCTAFVRTETSTSYGYGSSFA